MPAVDWTISVGSIITILTVVFAAGGFYFNTRNQSQEITEIKNTLVKMEGVVTSVAVQKVQIDNLAAIMTEDKRSGNDRMARMEKMLDELRHNKGFITS